MFVDAANAEAGAMWSCSSWMIWWVLEGFGGVGRDTLTVGCPPLNVHTARQFCWSGRENEYRNGYTNRYLLGYRCE